MRHLSLSSKLFFSHVMPYPFLILFPLSYFENRTISCLQLLSLSVYASLIAWPTVVECDNDLFIFFLAPNTELLLPHHLPWRFLFSLKGRQGLGGFVSLFCIHILLQMCLKLRYLLVTWFVCLNISLLYKNYYMFMTFD